MGPIVIILIIIMVLVMVGSVLFLAFTRQGKNLVTQFINNKKYVICHLKRASTDFEDIWRVVPNPDYYTDVGKFPYCLKPEYAALKWNGRLHYILNENDAIPKYTNRTDSDQEIMMQVTEIRTALNNQAYDLLYGKNKNIALILAGIGLIIAVIVAMYGIYEIQKIAPLVTWLYEHPPQAVIPVAGK